MVGCGGSDTEGVAVVDEYSGVWLSQCEPASDESFYYVSEYVIYDSLIEVNSHLYQDSNCSVPREGLSFLKAADVEYLEFEIVITRGGYSARFYNGLIWPIEGDSDPLDHQFRFYVDGDFLYEVLPVQGSTDYAVLFDDYYVRH